MAAVSEPANSNTDPPTFDMRQDAYGWTVYDTTTGEPARVNDVAQVGLELEKADDLVDLLNLLAQQQSRSRGH